MPPLLPTKGREGKKRKKKRKKKERREREGGKETNAKELISTPTIDIVKSWYIANYHDK